MQTRGARVTMKPILPDVMAPGLTVVFCGTAAGTVSAQRGAYYAHPQNKFWRTLHRTGLTPRLFKPEEFRALPQLGIGLTDIAKHAFGMDSELPPGSLGRTAAETLRAMILDFSPRILAFTSLKGGRRVLGPKTTFGEQRQVFGATRLWVLPSPSPAAHWNWDESVWTALAEAVRSLRSPAA
jgi:TDG/mug DNA glycosylase family protein